MLQIHHVTPEVQLVNTPCDYNSYFASSMNSHIGVVSHNDGRYTASANTYVAHVHHHTYHNSRYHAEKPRSIMNSLNFNAASNIQHHILIHRLQIDNMWLNHKTCQ